MEGSGRSARAVHRKYRAASPEPTCDLSALRSALNCNPGCPELLLWRHCAAGAQQPCKRMQQNSNTDHSVQLIRTLCIVLCVGVGCRSVVKWSAPTHILHVHLRPRQHERHNHTVVAVGCCVVKRRPEADDRKSTRDVIDLLLVNVTSTYFPS